MLEKEIFKHVENSQQLTLREVNFKSSRVLQCDSLLSVDWTAKYARRGVKKVRFGICVGINS
jgi:hypothetical protein